MSFVRIANRGFRFSTLGLTQMCVIEESDEARMGRNSKEGEKFTHMWTNSKKNRSFFDNEQKSLFHAFDVDGSRWVFHNFYQRVN